MVQIEIDLLKIERGTHEGRVKVTRGGKTFYRKQRLGTKGTEVSAPKMQNLNVVVGDDEGKRKKILDDGGWNFNKSTIFTDVSATMGAYTHTDNSKIYALSVLDKCDMKSSGILYIIDIEVNPDMQRQGYGKQVMKDIISNNREAEEISVGSMNEASNKFYESIGMKKIPKKDPKHFQKFIGDKAWMETMMK